MAWLISAMALTLVVLIVGSCARNDMHSAELSLARGRRYFAGVSTQAFVGRWNWVIVAGWSHRWTYDGPDAFRWSMEIRPPAPAIEKPFANHWILTHNNNDCIISNDNRFGSEELGHPLLSDSKTHLDDEWIQLVFVQPWMVVTPLLLVALLPLPGLTARVRRRRLRGKMRCEKCGYDLRATPERCPECGMERSG